LKSDYFRKNSFCEKIKVGEVKHFSNH